MAIKIRTLASGGVPLNDAIYTASASPPVAALVKTMRFVNRSATTAATLKLEVKHTPPGQQLLQKALIPLVTIPPKGMYAEAEEIALASGDSLWATASGEVINEAVFDFVVSGLERES